MRTVELLSRRRQQHQRATQSVRPKQSRLVVGKSFPVSISILVSLVLSISSVCTQHHHRHHGDSPPVETETAQQQLKAAGATGASSEWTFDNQALRSISSELLCARSNQTSQPVNVVTFIGNQINSIEPNAFRCVASELRILVLSSNEITGEISGRAFEGLYSVQVLLLDNNLLSSIPSEDSLGPLRSLRHLNLADNKIERLEQSSFGPHLSGLISLNLAGNPLLRVHPSALVSLVELKTLTLSRCSNHSFAEWPLDGLAELRFLHLDRSSGAAAANEFRRQQVTEKLCQNSRKLSSLLLNSNALERVPQFEHCQNLLLLDLSHNNIRGSLSENFTQQPNLIDLYLGNNQLESIAERALIGLRKLQVLELKNNRIKQIESRAFLPVQPTLEELNLSHNPQLSQLSSLGLDQVKSLKCYGNHQLRDLPRFKSAQHLALTYAYHCCDYPSASSWPTDYNDDEGVESDSLIVREDSLSNSRRESQRDSSTSELILWPANHVTNSKRFKRKGLMDEDELLAAPTMSELRRVRGQHSIFHPIIQSRSQNRSTNRTRRSAATGQQQQQTDNTAASLRDPVRCLPSPSPFLPCKDLFDSWLLRAGIWSVFLLGFLGNTLVIIVLSSVRQTSSSSALTSIMWLAHSKRHIDVPRFLVINLAIADLLMALYLGLLAFVDLSTLGEFRLHAIRWQYSTGCKLAGFLAVLSSELSVFILAIITLERNYAITNAVHLNRRLSLQKAMFIMFLGYAFALGMAIMPLYGISDYRRFSVCLPLDVESSLGSQIYVITLIGINTFSFVLLLGCYLRMYFAIRGSQAWNANDLRIAKRMSILVLTDFLCWMPVIASGLASLFGYHMIGTEGMKILTIFVLPLNSVANPFLYAITTKKFRRDLSTLHRRTRALARRLECCSGQPTNHVDAMLMPYNNKHHQKLNQCLTAYNNNRNNNNKYNHYRHDLLLMQHKGGGQTAKAQAARPRLGHNSLAATRRSIGRSPPKSLAAPADRRSATPLANYCPTCISCSCQQQQQQVRLGPRIVLESATQTSNRHLVPTAPLKKSRSTNSGLTMMAAARRCYDTEQHQRQDMLMLMKVQAKLCQNYQFNDTNNGGIHLGDGDAAASEAPPGGALTKVEESMMMTGDELSLHWTRPRSIGSASSLWPAAAANYGDDDGCGCGQADHRIPSPAAKSLLVQRVAGSGRPHKQCSPAAFKSVCSRGTAACSGSYLSVDPFQTAAAAAAGGVDLRSASACGQLASCRVVESDDNNMLPRTSPHSGKGQRKDSRVGGSFDTVRATSGGGGAIKLSRSIQRLLFDPLAKAWSSIQVSLNSPAGATTAHVDGHKHQQERHLLNKDKDLDHEGGAVDNVGPEIDDILIMSSPLRKIGERRMSRSCDALPKPPFNNSNDLQLNSPSQSSGQDHSSSQYDNNDQRVLLATIDRLTAGNHRRSGKLAKSDTAAASRTPSELARSGGQSNLAAKPFVMRGKSRCTRCRSWSPALLTKLENCIYQMRSKISSGFAVGSAHNCNGATRLESACELHEQSGNESSMVAVAGDNIGRPEPLMMIGVGGDRDDDDDNQVKGASSESELELEGIMDDVDEDDLDLELELELELDQVDEENDDDDEHPHEQHGEPFSWSPARWRHTSASRIRATRKGAARLRQQSSFNSDTLSTRTAGTLMTNMSSLSSDSNASIQLAVAASSAKQAAMTRLDIITDTHDDDDDT